ncbi:hypothetical protein EJ04DRAFT_591237, partial [Polyplosphaeria fusca]
DDIKKSAPNKDCLVRLYLGKRRNRHVSRFFQLRNFSLHLDQMEELALNVKEFAVHIADALTVMHWAVKTDANDVEFVLGSAPDRTALPERILPKTYTAAELRKMKPNTSTWADHFDDFKHSTTHIWMLDFNRCEEFTPDEAGMQQIVQAFFQNDPYFPRPPAELPQDQELWDTFAARYLEFSASLVEQEIKDLPNRFIELAVLEQAKRKG